MNETYHKFLKIQAFLISNFFKDLSLKNLAYFINFAKLFKIDMVNLPFILGIDAFSRALFVQRTPSIIVWPQCYTLPFFSVFGLLCNSMPISISQSLSPLLNQYRNPNIRFLKHICLKYESFVLQNILET